MDLSLDLPVVATVFAVVFLAELPDKSLFASLVLGTRFRPLHVWLGVSAAFAVHVVIAVAAGGLLTLLPRPLVETVVAVLFAVGAYLLLRPEPEPEPDAPVETPARARSAWSVIGTSFGVVFVGEWGDVTQLATANLTARYADPLSVGLGALLGLLSVAGLAVTLGGTLVRHVPLSAVRRVAGVVLLVLAVVSAVQVLR